MTQSVAPILVSGPYLTCPRSLRLVRRDNQIEVGCEIRTEPRLPAANVTWSLKGGATVKQKPAEMEKTAYGQDIRALFDLSKQVERDDEEITIVVQVGALAHLGLGLRSERCFFDFTCVFSPP